MPSIISAGTTANTGLNLTADTSGNLVFQTNGNTTAMTIDTSQNVTYANGVSFTGVIGGNGANISSMNASNLTSGTVANARTTAASANGASTIVLRDSSGAFSAGVITANGSGLTGISASNISSGTLPAAQAVSGSIIQVAQYLNYTYASTTNSSFTATGYAVTITPKSATSTMLIRCALSGSQSASNGAGYFTIYRNGSNLAGANGYNTLYSNASFSNPFRVPVVIELTNASGGTSAITYEVYFKTNTVGTVALNQDSTASAITVMEIAP